MTTEDRPQADRKTALAEDLLLLLFQPDSGTIAAENVLFYVLGGAVVTQLAQDGHVEATDVGLRGTLVTALGDTPPDDDLLREAWQYVAPKPRGVQTVLAAIGPSLRAPLLDRLVESGDLRRESGKALGIFPTTTLHDGGTGRRAALVESVRAVLADGAPADARTGALAALLSASGALPTLDREIPWNSVVATRAKQLEQGDWGADAAAEAVTRTMTAIVVNATVASVVAATVVAGR